MRYVEVDRADVADRPGEPCVAFVERDHPEYSLCGRYTGPATTRSGRPTDIAYELCSRAGDIQMRFRSSQEIVIHVSDGGGHYWFGFERPRGGEHTETLHGGRCFRYTAHWDGLDASAKPLPPGDYTVAAWPNADWQLQAGPSFHLTITN